MSARVLIVDDEAIIAISWECLLEDEGYEVMTALSAKEAIESLHVMRPDIVFTDLIMPEMDGIELCRRIKTEYPETDVVLISGNPYQVKDAQKNFKDAGGRGDILIKPVFAKTLIETVEKIMREKG